jgi:spore maturation protein CgeB
MRVVLFCHSLVSDWNHGNAHFLRGIATELQRRGHEVEVLEPRDGWSRQNLLAEIGDSAFEGFHATYPTLSSTLYDPATLDLDATLDGAALVLVHEWNEPALVARIGAHRRAGGQYRLLFHDTHHRSATDPAGLARYDLDEFDGVLAFGEVIREIYRARGWGKRAWTWHEAADTTLFRPLRAEPRRDLVWIGNWGDGERTRELHEFLLEPIQALGANALIHGVRYPAEGLAALDAAGCVYGGYLPNTQVPAVFAQHRATVHVPRRPYAESLPGIPTIRVFEALACGIPLVCAPWEDREGLFTPGEDYLVARDGVEMQRQLRTLLCDAPAAAALAEHGRRTILARHSCAHRVEELLAICRELGLSLENNKDDQACAAD